MDITLHFDSSQKVEVPNFILAHRNGEKIGLLTNVYDVRLADSLTDAPEFSFSVAKYHNNEIMPYWDELVSFKLIWVQEYDTWFEAIVEFNHSDQVTKSVTLTRLGEAELAMTNVYGLEVNTETEIEYDEDYAPTVLYNSKNTQRSLLHRILHSSHAAPHYQINHVDKTVRKIQRTFSFNDKSVYDCLKEVADAENLYISYDSSSNEEGHIKRGISIYDLHSNCKQCGYRGAFTAVCPNCNSTKITEGYGVNTTICVSRDDLGEELTVSDNVDNIRNCYHITGGDDMITSTATLLNPNGSQYLWKFTPEMKKDMSEKLRSKLDHYETEYINLLTARNFTPDNYTCINGDVIQVDLETYNNIIRKYQGIVTDIYDNRANFLALEYTKAQLRRKQKYPTSKYVGNVDIYNRPVIYNADDNCYSTTITGYQEYKHDKTYTIIIYTTILQNGEVLDDEAIYEYLHPLSNLSESEILTKDKADKKIIYKVLTTFEKEPIKSNNLQAAMSWCDEWSISMHETQDKIYHEEGELFIKYNEALLYKNSIGDTTSNEKFLVPVDKITGYPQLIAAFYNAMDLYEYLHDGLLPSQNLEGLTAQTVAASLTVEALSPVAVGNIKNLSLATANTNVLNAAKLTIDPSFKVSLLDGATLKVAKSGKTATWTGAFQVVNAYDKNDKADTAKLKITINDKLEEYIQQKVMKNLYNNTKGSTRIQKMITDPLAVVKTELRKYSFTDLTMILKGFEGCLTVLKSMNADESTHEAYNLYSDISVKYTAIETELKTRSTECENVLSVIGDIQAFDMLPGTKGLYGIIEDVRQYFSMQNYFGMSLWIELHSFKREENFSNENFISDSIEDDSAALVKRAYELLQEAEKQIDNNNQQSYQISSNLKNLLLIPEFEPLKQYFSIGNWIKIKTDDNQLFKLRLVSYTFDFNSPDNLSVEFSDISNTSNIRRAKTLISKIDDLLKSQDKNKTDNDSKFDQIADDTTTAITDNNDDLKDQLDDTAEDLQSQIDKNKEDAEDDVNNIIEQLESPDGDININAYNIRLGALQSKNYKPRNPKFSYDQQPYSNAGFRLDIIDGAIDTPWFTIDHDNNKAYIGDFPMAIASNGQKILSHCNDAWKLRSAPVNGITRNYTYLTNHQNFIVSTDEWAEHNAANDATTECSIGSKNYPWKSGFFKNSYVVRDNSDGTTSAISLLPESTRLSISKSEWTELNGLYYKDFVFPNIKASDYAIINGDVVAKYHLAAMVFDETIRIYAEIKPTVGIGVSTCIVHSNTDSITITDFDVEYDSSNKLLLATWSSPISTFTTWKSDALAIVSSSSTIPLITSTKQNAYQSLPYTYNMAAYVGSNLRVRLETTYINASGAQKTIRATRYIQIT